MSRKDNMISKKELMLRIIDLECIVNELEEKIYDLEHPKKVTKKASKK